LRDRLLRDVGVRISAGVLLVFALAAVVAWHLLPPPLPQVVRLGTGPAGGQYARFGEGLGAKVAKHGIELELVSTAGSMENIRLLLDGQIDVGLVQSGNLSDAEAARLESVAAVFYEPILVVERADWESSHIAAGRIAIGPSGSGVNALARELLADQGIAEDVPPGTRLVEIAQSQAVQALQAGEVDSGIFATSLEVPWVRELFTDPELRVTPFEIAEAFTRHYRYLRRLVIPAGLIDLRDEIPPRDVQVIATTASLVTTPDVHSALIPLLIASARDQLRRGDLLSAPGEFPSQYGVDAPLAEEALQYFQRGPSFFYRWLPFRWAFTATLITIILIPFLTLLYPLFRSAGPTYTWLIRRRVYRWYRVLRRVEEGMDASNDAASLEQVHDELERVGDEIRHTRVPASYGANLFALRAHHRLLLDRLESLERRGGAS